MEELLLFRSQDSEAYGVDRSKLVGNSLSLTERGKNILRKQATDRLLTKRRSVLAILCQSCIDLRHIGTIERLHCCIKTLF